MKLQGIKIREPFYWFTLSCSAVVLAFILIPLIELMTAPSMEALLETLEDRDVLRSIWLSMYTSASAALISFVFGTPLAFILARSKFRGKHLIESIIDLPIVIPHPVIGIAILSVAGKNHLLGQWMAALGIRIMGSPAGIITVLTFVGLPFYINTVKDGFEAIPRRLENVSRSLGASIFSTFFRITFPLAWRSMVVGFIMCSARAISEFGAVVIVAYHPMIAPVMIYERFEEYGLKYSQPIAVWLVAICLLLFFLLRWVALSKPREA